MDSIENAWDFSGKTPITLSRGFSVEILIGVTLSWKTELNMSRSSMMDFILFSLFTLFYFTFLFLEQTRVRVYQSRCHISHKLMA